MKQSTTPKKTTPVEETQRIHDVTQETYTHLRLGEGGAIAELFDDGMVVITQGGICLSLNGIESMHLANAIIARSQEADSSPYDKVATALTDRAAHREFLASVEDDEEYAAYLDHKATPSAEHY